MTAPGTVRPALRTDQATIRTMIWQARLSPVGLHWSNFLVCELDGVILGVGQIKTHRDGSRELASLAVKPRFQGRGIGSSLVRALLEPEQGPVFLFCRQELARYYARFGFRLVGGDRLPPSLARLLWLGQRVSAMMSWFLPFRLLLVAMRWR